MDLGFFGIIDVVILVLVAVFAIVGFKKGFLLKLVELAGALFGLIAAILLVKPVADYIGPRWLNEPVYEKINNVLMDDSNPLFAEAINPANREEQIMKVLEGLEFPDFLDDIIVKSLSNVITEGTVREFVENSITPIIGRFVILIISFLILYIGSRIAFFILKILIKAFRKMRFFKVVDNILGLAFGLVKVVLLIFVLLLVLSIVLNISSINSQIGDFVRIDMQLDTTEFRLSKYLYNHNWLKVVFDLFL